MVDGLMDALDKWMDGWMDGWMDAYINVQVHYSQAMPIYISLSSNHRLNGEHYDHSYPEYWQHWDQLITIAELFLVDYPQRLYEEQNVHHEY